MKVWCDSVPFEKGLLRAAKQLVRESKRAEGRAAAAGSAGKRARLEAEAKRLAQQAAAIEAEAKAVRDEHELLAAGAVPEYEIHRQVGAPWSGRGCPPDAQTRCLPDASVGWSSRLRWSARC